jgi:hypothetical protein
MAAQHFDSDTRPATINPNAQPASSTGITEIAAFRIDDTGHPNTGSPLTRTSELQSTTIAWGNFAETASLDMYSVFFFFSASSLDCANSTFEIEQGTYTGVSFSTAIYRIKEDGLDTNYYALLMVFPERYEDEAGSATYRVGLHLQTNDPETFINTTVQTLHTYCKRSS